MYQEGAQQNKIWVSHINVRQSIWLLLFRIIIFEIIIDILFLLSYPFICLNLHFSPIVDIFSAPFGLFILFTGSKFFLVVFISLQWINEYFEITSDRIIHWRGIVFRQERTYDFNNITDIGIEQSFLGKLFKFGSIRLYDWYLRKYDYMYFIHNPLRFYHILKQLIPESDEEKKTLREHLLSGDEDEKEFDD